MRLLPLLFLLACGGTDVPDESQCPAVDDPCMNEDNLAECLDAEAECPGNLVTMESCPLQFACG